jgi:Aldo/keto reductase family
MEYRLLGRTGVSVSSLCLGTIMFGPWGNGDRTDSIRVIHHALDAGINFVDTADVYSGGIGGNRRRRSKRPSRRHRARNEVLHVHGRPARLHRSLPGAPAQRDNRCRGNPWCADRWLGSSPNRLRTRSWSAVSRKTSCRPRSATAWAPSSTARTPTSAARPSARFDMTTPANQRKLDVVEELALLAEQSGLTLIELALAWAINHPRGHLRDHRPADHGTARIPAAVCRGHVDHWHPGSHRRTRRARRDT